MAARPAGTRRSLGQNHDRRETPRPGHSGSRRPGSPRPANHCPANHCPANHCPANHRYRTSAPNARRRRATRAGDRCRRQTGNQSPTAETAPTACDRRIAARLHRSHPRGAGIRRQDGRCRHPGRSFPQAARTCRANRSRQHARTRAARRRGHPGHARCRRTRRARRGCRLRNRHGRRSKSLGCPRNRHAQNSRASPRRTADPRPPAETRHQTGTRPSDCRRFRRTRPSDRSRRTLQSVPNRRYRG
jgi:hypothetical protein